MAFGAWLWQSDVTAGERCVVLVNGRGPDKKEEVVHVYLVCASPLRKERLLKSPQSMNHTGQ